MSKVFSLKEWVTIAGATRYLTDAFEEEVSESDVLQFCLDEKLVTSVNFVELEPVRRCRITKSSIQKGLDPYKIYKYGKKNKWIEIDREPPTYISGIYDLSFLGSEKESVAARHFFLTGGSTVAINLEVGAILQDKEELFEYCKGIDDSECNNPFQFDSAALGCDHQLVIRTSELEAFVKTHVDLGVTDRPTLKPDNPKATESLLKMIIAMAIGGYGYNRKAKKSPTTSEIVRDAENLGLNIDEDTVRKWLKKGNELVDQDPLN